MSWYNALVAWARIGGVVFWKRKARSIRGRGCAYLRTQKVGSKVFSSRRNGNGSIYVEST